MFDSKGRKIHYLRLSVTDLCNLRCRYCMPDGVDKLEREDILTYEEFLHLAALFARCGVDTVRVTGGEPLVRKGVEQLVKGLKAIPGIRKVTMTTNAVLLEQQLPALLEAGLDSVNISLDTLDPALFAKITARDEFAAVQAGIHAALESGIPVKLNCVPQVGVNERAGSAGRSGTGQAPAGAVHRDDAHRLRGGHALYLRPGAAGPLSQALAGAGPAARGGVCRAGRRPGGLLYRAGLERGHRLHCRCPRQVLRLLQPGAADQSGLSAPLPCQ